MSSVRQLAAADPRSRQPLYRSLLRRRDLITAETEAPEQAISRSGVEEHQMPAWHLITHDGKGSP